MTELSIDVARKVLTTIDAGLVAGLGEPVAGQMCVEAAVCFARTADIVGKSQSNKEVCRDVVCTEIVFDGNSEEFIGFP